MTTADAADLDASSVPLRAYAGIQRWSCASGHRCDPPRAMQRPIALGVIYDTFIDIARVNHLPAESNDRVACFHTASTFARTGTARCACRVCARRHDRCAWHTAA